MGYRAPDAGIAFADARIPQRPDRIRLRHDRLAHVVGKVIQGDAIFVCHVRTPRPVIELRRAVIFAAV